MFRDKIKKYYLHIFNEVVITYKTDNLIESGNNFHAVKQN